jgi:hypothetical protein
MLYACTGLYSSERDGGHWAPSTPPWGLAVRPYSIHRPQGIWLLQVASPHFPVTFLPKYSRARERSEEEEEEN